MARQAVQLPGESRPRDAQTFGQVQEEQASSVSDLPQKLLLTSGLVTRVHSRHLLNSCVQRKMKQQSARCDVNAIVDY